jgi:hypothetical protein
VLGRREKFTTQYFDFETGRTPVLFRKEGPEQHQSTTVSPDEQWILFSEAPAGQSDLMLVENFR